MTSSPTSGSPAARTDDRPVLAGHRVTLRPGTPGDAIALHAIMADPSVLAWWLEPDPVSEIAAGLAGDDQSLMLVVEIAGQVAGGIQYDEETDPKYRQASIDIYLGSGFQSQGAGAEAVALLARYLFERRGHHRLTIDPAASNTRAIKCYRKVGFQPVGIMRQYERGADGTFHDGLLMDLLPAELADPARVIGESWQG